MLMYNAHSVHQDLINDVVEGIFFYQKDRPPQESAGTLQWRGEWTCIAVVYRSSK